MAIYQKIASQLREEIDNDYNTGDLLLPEKQYADRFNVNRHTVRRAIDELVQDGLVRRYQGIGNRVVKEPIDYALHDKAAFSYNLSQSGLSLETEVIECCADTLPAALINKLSQPISPQIVKLTTRRFIENDPVCLIHHYLFNVSQESLSHFQSGSLHQFLREHHQLSLRRGCTRLRARMPSLEECQQLGIGRGIPVMEVHTQNFLNGSTQLVEYSVALSRSDLFEYSVEPS